MTPSKASSDLSPPEEGRFFSDPATNFPLTDLGDCYFSPTTGFSYPVIRGIPVLRTAAAVLTSALDGSASENHSDFSK
jgi:hypothetical protein